MSKTYEQLDKERTFSIPTWTTTQNAEFNTLLADLVNASYWSEEGWTEAHEEGQALATRKLEAWLSQQFPGNSDPGAVSTPGNAGQDVT